MKVCWDTQLAKASRFFITWAVFALSGNVALAETELTRMSVLVAEGRSKVVVETLKDRNWQRGSNPRLLIEYCNALFEIEPEKNTCQIPANSAFPAKRFADGLWLIWTGNSALSKAVFSSLFLDANWSKWGAVGLMEWASHTENYFELGSLLTDHISMVREADSAFVEIHREYAIHLALESANWDMIDRLLRHYNQRQISSSPWLFEAQAQSFFVRDKRADLRVAIHKARHTLGSTSVFFRTEANYELLNSDIGSSVRKLNKHAVTNSSNTELALQNAYLEVLYGDDEVSRKALNVIQNIAASRVQDTSLLLNISVSLALFRKVHESEMVRNMLVSNILDLSEFSIFHVLEAWKAVYRGDLTRANHSVKLALSRAPLSQQGNHLKLLLAKASDDVEEGTEALKTLFRIDPYNENYASIVLHFRRKHKTIDIEQLYKKVLAQKKKYSTKFQAKLLSSN